MPVSTPASPAPARGKRSALTGSALSDEVFDSSPSLLRPSRGDRNTVAGLQQFFSPPEAADLIAAVNGRQHSTVDLTAGDGSLLMGVEPDFRFGVEIDADQVKAHTYTPIHGDLQRAYPLLRLLRAQVWRREDQRQGRLRLHGPQCPRSASPTPQRYTHVLPGELERARDQLDAFLAERAAEEEGASFKLPVAA